MYEWENIIQVTSSSREYDDSDQSLATALASVRAPVLGKQWPGKRKPQP